MNSIQSRKQNQRIERISETTLVIGTDIAKKNHIARAFNFRGLELGKRCPFTNDLEGMKALLTWTEDLKQKHGMTEVLIGVEPTGHYWFPMYHYMQQKASRWCWLTRTMSGKVKNLITTPLPKTTPKMRALLGSWC